MDDRLKIEIYYEGRSRFLQIRCRDEIILDTSIFRYTQDFIEQLIGRVIYNLLLEETAYKTQKQK